MSFFACFLVSFLAVLAAELVRELEEYGLKCSSIEVMSLYMYNIVRYTFLNTSYMYIIVQSYIQVALYSCVLQDAVKVYLVGLPVTQV